MSDELKKARALLNTGDARSALKLLQAVIDKHPENMEAMFFCGHAYMQIGDAVSACQHFDDALRLDPDNLSLQNALGAALFKLGKLDESESVLRKAATQHPESYETLGNLGLALAQTGKHDEALEVLQTVMKSGVVTARIMEELGMELVRHNRPTRAQQLFTRLKQLQPDNAVANTYLGNFLMMQGDGEGARKLWAHVKATSPHYVAPYICEAVQHIKDGDVSEAVERLEDALRINKGNAEAAFLWAHTVDNDAETARRKGDVLEEIQHALDADNLSYEDRNNLLFAGGKIAASQNNHDAAFDYYDQANKRIWSRQGMSPSTYEKRTDGLLDVFNPIFFVKNKEILEREPKGNDKCGEGLIFVFGMPRSGTTLVEHIIARNPAVHAGGECTHIPGLINSLTDVASGMPAFPHSVRGLSRGDVRKIAGEHHALINKTSEGALFFSDKNLENYLWLGFMACLFPKAKFIHCTRHPIDTCLSAYFSYFAHNSLKYTYDLEALGKVYSQYERIMEAWHRVLPIKIHDVEYEAMTGQPEKTIRELVDYCGFEWRDAYLSPQSGGRQVLTASVAQVRKPINKKSVGRWKPYEAHLQPLLNALSQKGNDACQDQKRDDKARD